MFCAYPRAYRKDWWHRVTNRFLGLCIASVAICALSAVPAYAYQESASSTDPASTPAYACPTCHGLESGATSPTVAPRTVPSTWTYDSEASTTVGTRKGPHGGYTTGTQKCQICHSMHDAPDVSTTLLPEETVAATCFTCHDGTGGGGVYGVIYQRTGFDPTEESATASAGTAGGVHRIGRRYESGAWMDYTNPTDVPGGASSGATYSATFRGPYGELTCTDCHSPHNSNTVAPFIGDRKRSENDTTTSIATNRLLRTKPTTGDTTVTVYGTAWCQSCHKGSHMTSVTTTHPIETNSATRNYSKVTVLSGYNTSTTAGTGPLGGSNFGYIMPDTNGGNPGGHGTDKPICQQCHEDARDVGGTFGAADQFQVKSPSQVFAPALDGIGAGNPQFQNFPHESVNDGLLVETADGLCANCHYVAP